MNRREEYYLSKLYPLQDMVLEILSPLNISFYLTGGTALGRFYCHHRFSDGLDFFVNSEEHFIRMAEQIIQALQKHNTITTIIKTRAEDFVQLHCSKDEIILKVDIVNDIPYHAGGISSFPEYPGVDSWWNILSNKICALERREPKDVADILFICKKYPFRWQDVFSDAIKKVSYKDANSLAG